MMTRNNTVDIALSTLLAARVARRPVTADLAPAAVQTCGLFAIIGLVGRRRAARRPGLHEFVCYAAGEVM
jgi:hypothetical protein